MSRLSERRARVGAAVDRAFGETFRLQPRTQAGNDLDARRSIDTGRDSFEFIGRFTGAAQDLHARSRATSLQTTRPISTSAPRITLQRTALTGKACEGDVIERLKDGDVFVIGKLAEADFDRIVIHLRAGGV